MHSAKKKYTTPRKIHVFSIKHKYTVLCINTYNKAQLHFQAKLHRINHKHVVSKQIDSAKRKHTVQSTNLQDQSQIHSSKHKNIALSTDTQYIVRKLSGKHNHTVPGTFIY